MKSLINHSFIILVCVVMVFIAGKTIYESIELQQDNKRLIKNQLIITDSLTYYRDRLNTETAKTTVLEYSNNELKKLYPEIFVLLKNLNVKPARAQSITQAAIQQKEQITAPIRDTTIIINKLPQPVQFFTYADTWYNVNGVIDTANINLSIKSTDTINQVVYYERLKPWLWIFSPRHLVQLIQTKNPSNKVIYSRTIEIVK